MTFFRIHIEADLRPFKTPQFFIAPWQASSGWTWSFAAQGIITFFGATPIFAFLHFYGPKLRSIAGQPAWVNPEYDVL